MKKTYDVKLDLYKSDSSKTDLSGKPIQFVTGDENVYSISARLTSKDANFEIEDGIDVIVNIKPANSINSTDITAEIMDAETGLLEISFPGGFEVTGDYLATVYLKNGANSLTWGQRFIFNVAAGVAQA